MRNAFHDRFQAALSGDISALGPWCQADAARVGLAVHRNSMAKAAADALVAQFPTVERVVGVAWLSAAAVAHAADYPPRKASLLDYGAGFANWLTIFPPAADMPFLADLARLDWLWTEAYFAADADAFDPDEIVRLGADTFATHTLTPHPAARWACFPAGIPSLWQALQPPGEPPATFELDDAPECLLIVRPDLEVDHLVTGAGASAFLDACATGTSLADAAGQALAIEPHLDLAATFARLVSAGAFSTLKALT